MESHQPRTLSALPVFPLPDYFLFPGVVVPLQVFETRYRQMMDDLMDGPGRLVIAPLAADEPKRDGLPSLPETGTLAEIMHHEKLPDGRWLVLVAALDRVRISEVASDRLYRQVEAEVLPEPEVNGELALALRDRVTTALRTHASGEWRDDDDVTLGRLADLLLHTLEPAAEMARKAYFEADPCKRATMALAWSDLKAEAAD